ncbi:Lysophospholipase L1 [Fontibacillus panacisegetis]|uniref:Lysophospholipase L1 n=1 Tax=Fontibacillus panacisegetis TaxID=670482 RepID=A0A1G7FV95_9BACL|nr:GDSL-type esterase/lipase family protein [Fontibacillus panacisegetis]SDE79810.1 Lysophospholipase L1 [Fontibacillus panacisegetis]
MTTNRMMELLQDPEIKEAIEQRDHNNFLEYKKGLLKKYKMRNQYIRKGQILFVGSSLMEHFPIDEMQSVLGLDRVIYNRGVGGITTDELLTIMNECIFDLEPTKIFINIGSNDIGGGLDDGKKEILLENYNEILSQIKERLPESEVYVMAYYPVNSKGDFGLEPERQKSMFASRNNTNITMVNEEVKELAMKQGLNFINVNEGLTDEEGHLKAEFTVEGVHMWPNAYSVVLENMKKYL